jgi:S1-C subfamily serine protease
MASLVSTGRVERGQLGVIVQPVTPDLAEAFGLKEKNGALVGEITPGSPAERSGLQAGDVILEFNGKKVEGSAELRLMVSQAQPGSEIPAVVFRDGKTIDLTLAIGGSTTAAAAGPAPNDSPLDGLEVRDIDNSIRRQLGLPARLGGVLVATIDPVSPAARTGLQPGDVIFELNRRQLSGTRQFSEALRQAEGKRLLLRIWSRGTARYIVLE